MRIFVSYPGPDPDLAEDVAGICRKFGHEAFVAPAYSADLAGSEGFIARLAEEIDRSDAFLLCLTPNSVRAHFQRLEWQQAIVRAKPRPLIVYRGEWDPRRYDQHFHFSGQVQHFRIDTPEGRRDTEQAVRRLGPPDPKRFQFLRDLAVEAGNRLIVNYGRGYLAGRKPIVLDSRKNYATEIDREVQRFVNGEIRKRYPGECILAEERLEEDEGAPVGEGEGRLVWTADPLDGTLNFVSGDDRFCCGIGVARDGEPYMGAVFVPARMELYTGGVGRPAERHLLREGAVQRLRCDELIRELAGCSTLTHVNSEAENIGLCFADDFPRRLHDAVRRVWMWGCGLLALTAVARGSHHLFVQRVTYPWDVVPGLAILHSAGGKSAGWPAPAPAGWRLAPAWAAASPDRDALKTGIVAACNETILGEFFRAFGPLPGGAPPAGGPAATPPAPPA